MFHQGLKYNTTCGHTLETSAYYGPIGPFSVGKHPRVNSLMTGIFNNKFSQPKYCFIWDVQKVLSFLNSLDSDKLELKMLTYKVNILLPLTRSSRAHEICYSEIRHLIHYRSGYTFRLSKITKASRKIN